ncbi:DNA mismatch repair protein MutS [Pelotomaculum propionicicum]|nr:DNA mismatch repair protein MutS [Pelotomaculum propionicicum]NLI14337.1 DNA mismatch repair protein MutS [Peptococcaceae bacterium]
MIRQYLEIKGQYPDAILFFRLGDFYEMFFDDASVAARELEITLTGRDGGSSERVPMCGVPYHAVDGYIAKLIGKGYRVAICDQVEDPAEAKGIVRREVTRVITPGTIMEGQLLEEKKNNFLACVAQDENGYGLAVTDITTGSFMVCSFSGARAYHDVMEEIARIMPAEVIVPFTEEEENGQGIFHWTGPLADELRLMGPVVSGYSNKAFSRAQAVRALEAQFGENSFLNLETVSPGLAVTAAGALVSFLKDTQKRDLAHLNEIQFYQPGKYMLLDLTARRNLELTRSMSDNTKKFTLLSVLDYTVTSMGGRLLRNWIEQPLLIKEDVIERLDAVEELVGSTLSRQDYKNVLKNIYDLERLAGKISFGTVNPRDLIALRKSLAQLSPLKKLLSQSTAAILKRISDDIDPMEDIKELLDNAIADEPPLSTRDGGIIKKGYNSEVDSLRSVKLEARSMLAGLEERERSRTGIKSLKVGYNRVFGYYLEVTKSYLSMVPDDYRRRQTLANAERYITPELKEYEDNILGAEERLLRLENRLFNQIRDQLLAQIRRIQSTAQAVAGADTLYSLAEASAAGRYVRPEINNNGRLLIRDGRHPVLEKALGPGLFVPNDTEMDNEQNRLALITGPNMAGKSTYMRQVALIVLMAQLGCFVPASEAKIDLVDRIFTRIGASDDIAGGQSTFMVEMNECRSIVASATARSLIILDEVGRGTSTYDGISIARALAEYIHLRIGAKTLFSTHYLELTDLDSIPGIVNLNVAVKEQGENIIFLRKVINGRADRSYGIHVAKLAGLPLEIISRATEILKGLETARQSNELAAAALEEKSFSHDSIENPVIEEIRQLDILGMTPLEAISKLYELQKKIDKKIFNNLMA